MGEYVRYRYRYDGSSVKEIEESERKEEAGGMYACMVGRYKNVIGALYLPVGITHVGPLRVTNEAVPNMWRAIGQ